MCYQLIELYSVCRCMYYQHAIDRCASSGDPRHQVERRQISVGYACPAHAGRGVALDKQHVQARSSPDDEDLASETASIFSDVSNTSTAFTFLSDAGEDPVERLFRDLLVEPQLEHLLPQAVRSSRDPVTAERNITRFLRRFSQDLKANSTTVPEFQASRYVRQCRHNIAQRIIECHSVELEQGIEQPHVAMSERVQEPEPEKELEEDEKLDIFYDDLTEFLFQGPAFESFRRSIQEYVEKSGAQPRSALEEKLVNGANMWDNLVESCNRLRRGRKRLWWTCVSQRSR